MCTSTHIPGKIFTVFRIALRSTAVTVLSQAQSYRTRVLVTVHRVPGLADVGKRNIPYFVGTIFDLKQYVRGLTCIAETSAASTAAAGAASMRLQLGPLGEERALPGETFSTGT